MTDTNTAEREAFKAAHQHLDLVERPDAWGRPVFRASHVEAIWEGWQARASLAASAGSEPVAIYHGRCVIDCGEHGHLDMELLKMIPAGTKLYTHPSPPEGMAGWISLSEQPPEDGVLKLFCNMKAESLAATFFVDWMVGGKFCGNRHNNATHYQELPPLPASEAKEL